MVFIAPAPKAKNHNVVPASRHLKILSVIIKDVAAPQQKSSKMKVCHCRNFDEAAAAKVIKQHNIKHAENIHKHICGQKPDCGTCLGGLQALTDEFQKVGKVPNIRDITREKRKESVRKLCERYAAEEDGNSQPPAFKKRYISIIKKQP